MESLKGKYDYILFFFFYIVLSMKFVISFLFKNIIVKIIKFPYTKIVNIS